MCTSPRCTSGRLSNSSRNDFVTGPALDDDDALAQRPLQTGKRFLPVLAVGDDLGDHRVELRGDGIAFRYSGVNAHARPGQNPEPLDNARSGSKTVVRIFRIQPHLDGMTGGARRFAFQAAAARDVDLKFHEIEPGCAFGHRMFDLQPGVHLHEQEAVDFRFVQELHRAGVVIARRLTQAHRRLAQRLILFGRKRRRRSFFEDFLVASLDGAVAHAGGPRRPIVVGNDLDLDVARALAPVAP